MDESFVRRSVLLTLAYTHQFEFPLTVTELWQRQLSGMGTYADSRHIHRAVANLVAEGKVTQVGEFVVPKGSEELIKHRQQKALLSERKWREMRAFLDFIRNISWVQAVAVTGSVAMNNARDEDDDIDFMIITKSGRMWLVRVLVVLFAWWKGKRRSWANEEPNSWCFNLWVEEDFLWKLGERKNVYIAYELCQARFVLDRENVALRLLVSHPWVRDKVPVLYATRVHEERAKFESTRVWADNVDGKYRSDRLGITHRLVLFGRNSAELLLVVNGVACAVVNLVAFLIQKVYMWPHQTTERVGLGFAFFHPRNTNGIIKRRWKEIIQHVSNPSRDSNYSYSSPHRS